MAEKLFVDTSAWLALFIPSEPMHKKMAGLVEEEIKSRTLLFTSNDVLTETVTRLVYENLVKSVPRFWDYIDKAIGSGQLVELWTDDLVQKEAISMVMKFADKKISFADATSGVHMRHNSIAKTLTLDADFKYMGFGVLPELK